MGVALAEARLAAKMGEVPVGAALYISGELISRAHNVREADNNPLGHAECLVIKEAAEKVGSWRLEDAALVVTLEPCTMCMGAMIQARVPLLIYGADDMRAGAAGSLYDLADDPRLNHRIEVIRGVRREEAAALLKGFFSERRG
ncbi:MAG: tRNA-specific adenosine deaminase [Deltaproteobacteria bacterium]|nr:MAG: tRNA-specific adenosine deaminase [Deltaproteobacteria bacterium]